MKNLGIILKGFCKEQYQKYLTNVRMKQEEKEWQDTKMTVIDLLNMWLVYLDKQKFLKVYRGLYPDVHEMQRKFFVLFNPDAEPKTTEKEYNFFCQNCWIDFLNMLNQKLMENQQEMSILEQAYAEKCQQYQDNTFLIDALKNDLKLEADRRLQTKYLQQIRMLVIENMRLFREGQELCKKHTQLENICSRICKVLNLVQRGRKPEGGYYNNQPDQKLFVLRMK